MLIEMFSAIWEQLECLMDISLLNIFSRSLLPALSWLEIRMLLKIEHTEQLPGCQGPLEFESELWSTAENETELESRKNDSTG